MGRRVIQVPMDDALLGALDTVSRQQGRPRAEIVRAACRMYLRYLEEESLEKAYMDGYRRIPERPHLGETQAALAGRVLTREEC